MTGGDSVFKGEIQKISKSLTHKKSFLPEITFSNCLNPNPKQRSLHPEREKSGSIQD